MNTISPDQRPTTQVGVGAMLGALVTVAAWVSDAFFDIPIPPGVQGALHTAIIFGVQYWIGPPKNVGGI